MDWEELALTIGDKAEEIISNDRGDSQRNGKIICFISNHTNKHDLKWLPTEAGSAGKFHCCACEKNYSIIDHAKWCCHDNMKEAHNMLCELAGVHSQSSSPSTIDTPKVEKVETPATLPNYPAVEPKSRSMTDKGIHYLTGRGISKQTIKAYHVTSDDNDVFLNYVWAGSLVKVKARIIGDCDNGRDKYGRTPKGGTNVIYGQHLHKSQRMLAVCEGEIDALSLHESLADSDMDSVIMASSVPSGASSTSWIENSMAVITKFEAVILITDNDDAGRAGMEKAASKLMHHVRVMTADVSAYGNDINDILQNHGTKTVCRVITEAQEYLPDFTVDLANMPDRVDATYSMSGFYMLDKPLRGLAHGLTTLFTGHSSEGKTTILRQVASYNAMNKTRIGLMFGEETAQMFRDLIIFQTYRKHDGKKFNVNRDRWENVDFVPTDELVHKFNREIAPYVSLFDVKHLQKKQRITKLYEWIRYESSIYGTKLFIIDNMMKLEVGMGDNTNSAQGDIIDAIENIAQTLMVHIIIVAHPKKEQPVINHDSVSGSKKLINTVDNVVVFQRFDKMADNHATAVLAKINRKNEYDHVTAFFKVMKNRVWGEEPYVALRYDEETRCIHDLSNDGSFHYGYTIPGRLYEPQEEI